MVLLCIVLCIAISLYQVTIMPKTNPPATIEEMENWAIERQKVAPYGAKSLPYEDISEKDRTKKEQTARNIAKGSGELWQLGKYAKHYTTKVGRPLKFTWEEAEFQIDTFFAICEKYHISPNVAGLAVAFGINRKTLLRWESEDFEISPLIKEAKNFIEYIGMANAESGQTNPIFSIYRMKVHHGLVEAQEINLHATAGNRDKTEEQNLLEQLDQ